MRLFLPLLVFACSDGDKDDDTSTASGPNCDGTGDLGLTIGTGAGDVFNEVTEGAVVGLDIAPQGGFGVSIRAKTTGLKADDLVDILLVTEMNEVQVGSFLNEQGTLYCQDDGHGLIWGVVVGFDPTTWETNNDLLGLNGEIVDLVVTAFDTEGDEVTGRVSVEIEVGS
jgi:hypothetical protein